MSSSESACPLIPLAHDLAKAVDALHFAQPVAFVYNPLNYARAVHEDYLRRFGCGRKRVVFLGMNPGPFGMAQTGVPFGEVDAVRNWMKLSGAVLKPEIEHPKRPIEGLGCPRSEVSGRRLWGLFSSRFGPAEEFFRDHFVLNYCPLVFMDEGGRNLTPDKFPASDAAPLFAACDKHLRGALDALQPEWAIGVGAFARERLENVISASEIKIGQVLHPSPASPAANRDWAGTAVRQLTALGVW